MRYEGNIFRPPSEAYSLLVQVTIGCTHNKCTFCSMYKDKKFRVRDLDEVIQDLKWAKEHYRRVERIFLCDGDALALSNNRLMPILEFISDNFPECERVTVYGRAKDALKKTDEEMRQLYEAGITMNGQIVLCKGVNDGEELEYSLQEMAKYAPVLQSVSVVPVGLTKFRDGLYPLESFTKEDAKAVLEQIHRWQKIMYEKHGIHFIHASDEWYILAGEKLPEEGRYDGYLQLENGVGMLRLLDTEVREAVANRDGDDRSYHVTVATGRLAAPYIEKCMETIREKYPKITFEVIAIKNNFFGEKITVSGLITGQDLTEQLSDRKLGDRLLIPCNMLRSGENVFLDDITVTELSEKLGREIIVVDPAGADLVSAVLDSTENKKQIRRQMYEQTGSGNSGQA